MAGKTKAVLEQELAAAKETIADLRAQIEAGAGDTHHLHLVQILGEVIKRFKVASPIPPASMRRGEREYWKSGARAHRKCMIDVINETGHYLFGPLRPLATDGELFNYMVRETAYNPERVKTALQGCADVDDYRGALYALIEEDEKAIVSPTVAEVDGVVEL